MNEPIKKRRRRRMGDSTPLDLSFISRTETEVSSSTEPTDPESKNEHFPPNTPQASVDSVTTHQMTIDRIRSEINEDKFTPSLMSLNIPTILMIGVMNKMLLVAIIGIF